MYQASYINDNTVSTETSSQRTFNLPRHPVLHGILLLHDLMVTHNLDLESVCVIYTRERGGFARASLHKNKRNTLSLLLGVWENDIKKKTLRCKCAPHKHHTMVTCV